MSQSLSQKIDKLPNTTGVYKFLNKNGKILYIGKAQRIKSRVKSYFSSTHLDRPWIESMIPKITDVEIIQTENEVEALILESNLIKKYKPKYNANLKDNKRYSYIHINTYQDFPKIEKTRETDKPGRYFGPYPDGRPIERMLKYLRKLYPFADCSLEFYPERDPSKVRNKRICLYYHLDQCPGPCDNLVSKEEYRENIDNIIKTLQGKKRSQIKKLREKMYNFADQKKYEKAATVRDKIKDLQYISQKIDIDLGDTEREFKKIKQAKFIEGISEIISKLKIPYPENKIDKFRTECYDISNISGEIAYGSMVVAKGAEIDKSDYRIFKIKESNKPNDIAMMKETLKRRLKYLKHKKIDNNESLGKKPHLVVLDGGKSHLSSLSPILKEFSISAISISKGKRLKRAGEKQTDEFWKIRPNGKVRKFSIKNPFLFQRLRDEAHRFAIKHHRKGRRANQKKSILDKITGVGPKRKKALMKKFKTVSNIKKANFEDINEVVKNKTVSERIIKKLSNQ